MSGGMILFFCCFENDGEIPRGQARPTQRSGVMWSREDQNKKATRYIRENASVKGQPNLTIGKFCHWVNDDLLPNETLELRPHEMDA